MREPCASSTARTWRRCVGPPSLVLRSKPRSGRNLPPSRKRKRIIARARNLQAAGAAASSSANGTARSRGTRFLHHFFPFPSPTLPIRGLSPVLGAVTRGFSLSCTICTKSPTSRTLTPTHCAFHPRSRRTHVPGDAMPRARPLIFRSRLFAPCVGATRASDLLARELFHQAPTFLPIVLATFLRFYFYA